MFRYFGKKYLNFFKLQKIEGSEKSTLKNVMKIDRLIMLQLEINMGIICEISFFTFCVMNAREFPQGFCGLFGGEVSLGHRHQLEADHEFAHRRRAQKRGVKVSVESPMRALLPVRGAVESHTKNFILF